MAGNSVGRLRLLLVMLTALMLVAGSGCLIIWKDEGSLDGEPVLQTCMVEQDTQTPSE